MHMNKLYLCILICTLNSACTNVGTQAIYSGWQQKNRQDCLSNPTQSVDTCNKLSETKYETYQKEVDKAR